MKVVGLMIIFIYAFFKFAWAYRLYNYVAIMVGAAPPASERDEPEAKAYAQSTAMVITDAGRHFNRGQRAFFFALGYLGWFLGPLPLIATTGGHPDRDVATAIRFGVASRHPRGLRTDLARAAQMRPVTTAIKETNSTAVAVNSTVSAVSAHSTRSRLGLGHLPLPVRLAKSAGTSVVDIRVPPHRTKRNGQAIPRHK